jgi:hypothetical protein
MSRMPDIDVLQLQTTPLQFFYGRFPLFAYAKTARPCTWCGQLSKNFPVCGQHEIQLICVIICTYSKDSTKDT